VSGRRYEAPRHDRPALVCTECGALVVDLPAHEAWHASGVVSVAECQDRATRLRTDLLDRLRRVRSGDGLATRGYDA